MKKRLVVIIVLAVTSLTFSGCIFAPSIDSVNKAGITESGRKGTLDHAVKGFNTARFWENYPLANTYAADENMETLKVVLQEKRTEGRIVESKVENVSFYDDAYKAEVDVLQKIQSASTNLVNPQIEKQIWTFSIYNGWKLATFGEKLT